MASRMRKIGPVGWFFCGFLIWSVAFVGARASTPSAGFSGPALKNSWVRTDVAARAQAGPPPRPGQAPAIPGPPGSYAANGEKTCLDCHDTEPATTILQTPHAVKADKRSPFAQHQCETCHGPSPEHIAAPSKYSVAVVFVGTDKSPAAKRNEVCLTCHESGMRTHWSGSSHETRGLACNDCHNVHAKEPKVLSKATQAEVCFTCHKEQRAQTHRISTHPLALTGLSTTAKLACSDCHNPHGTAGPKLLVKNSVNETCYTCHPEKRGPFLWEHAPVADDCTTCHTPHGSSNPSLLKTRPPLLCQECHTGDHGAQVNSAANLAGGNVTTVNGLQMPGAASPRAQLAARACLNCHVLIHGSNHPAGAKFQR
jgi:DmsE family decaheme c-type cytochrome